MVPCAPWWQSSRWSSRASQLSTLLTFPRPIPWTRVTIPFPSGRGPQQLDPVDTVYCRNFHNHRILAPLALPGPICRAPLVSAPWAGHGHLVESWQRIQRQWQRHSSPAQSRTCSQLNLALTATLQTTELLKTILNIFIFRLETDHQVEGSSHPVYLTPDHLHSSVQLLCHLYCNTIGFVIFDFLDLFGTTAVFDVCYSEQSIFSSLTSISPATECEAGRATRLTTGTGKRNGTTVEPCWSTMGRRGFL